MRSEPLKSHLRESALAQRINYAQCWEDEALLLEALDVGPGDRVLSVASGGDNSLALAIAGADVVALDLSFPQLALCELKLQGSRLQYAEYLQLLGLLEDGRRVFLYHRIREHLSVDARAYWDKHEEVIRTGVLQHGRFEKYLELFRSRVLPLIHGPAAVHELLACQDLQQQREFYETRWNRRRWRGLFRIFFSQMVMERLGRDPAQFAHVDGPVSQEFLRRCEHAFTEIPVRTNPYLQWMLLQNFVEVEHCSRTYLTREGFGKLAEARDRVTLVHSDIEGYLTANPEAGFSAFNFSNLFEYVSADHHEQILRAAADAAVPGARIAYWNLLVPRSRPQALADRIGRDGPRGAEMLQRDRAFVYGGFNVEHVLP
jgi:S-adenosylmethionine-diacylglycerol 3-amino-3-carboxypropyl transferase